MAKRKSIKTLEKEYKQEYGDAGSSYDVAQQERENSVLAVARAYQERKQRANRALEGAIDLARVQVDAKIAQTKAEKTSDYGGWARRNYEDLDSIYDEVSQKASELPKPPAAFKKAAEKYESDAVASVLQNDYGYDAGDAEELAANWTEIEASRNRQEADDWFSEKQKIYDSMPEEYKTIVLKGFLNRNGGKVGPSKEEKAKIEADGYNYDDMVEYYSRMRARESNAQMEEKVRSSSNLGLWGRNPAAVFATLGQIGDVPDMVRASLDEDLPYDQALARFTNYKNTVRDESTERIVRGTGSNLLGDAYQLGTSMADSALAMGVGAATGTEGVSLALMGTSAATSAYTDAIENGASDRQAGLTAIANGANEVIFEKLSLDHLWKMAKPAGKVTVKNAIKDWFAQAGIEGSEEVFTSIANDVADRAINGDQAEYYRNVRQYVREGYSESDANSMATRDYIGSLAKDMAGGFVSGGVFGGAGLAVGQYNYNKLGEAVVSNEAAVQQLYEAALSQEGTTAQEIAQGVESAGDLTKGDAATMIQSLAEVAEAEPTVKEILESALQEEGISKQEASRQAEQLIAMMRQGTNVSEEEQSANEQMLYENDAQARVYGNYLSGQYDSQTVASDAVGRVQQAYTQQREAKRSERSAAAVSKDTGIPVVSVQMRDTGERVSVVGFSDEVTDASLLRVFGTESTTVPVEEVSMSDDLRYIYYNASQLHNTVAANAAVECYKGETPTLYNLGVTTAYYIGKAGRMNYEEFKADPQNRMIFSGVNEATIYRMFCLGKHAAENETVEKKKAVPGKTVERRKGSTKGNFQGLDKAVQVHAKKIGVDIEAKKDVEHGANGYFAPSLMKIVLNEDRNMYQTLMHETSEFADAFNPEGMEKVYDSVIDFMATERGAAYLATMGRDYLERYRSIDEGESYRAALEELSNDVIGAMFSTDEGIREYMDWLNNDSGMNVEERKGIIDTIVDFLKRLFDSIKEYVDNHNLARNTERVLESSEEKLSHIRSEVLKAWNEAVEKSQEDGSKEGEGKKFSLSNYSYEELIRLPDMEVKTVEGSGLQQISYSPELKRTEIYRVAHENIKTFNNGESDNVLYNRYIGNVNIGNDGLKHSFRRVTNSDSTNRNISAAINLPLYFQNAIVINEAEGYRKSSDQAYVLIGTYRESDEQYFVRIVVNAKNNEVEEVKYVYAIATKKEGDAASDGAPDTRITSPSNIKIADFLEFVKRYFPNELSKDVAEQMNYERGASDIDGLKFSLDKDGNRVIREMPADIEEQISKNIELVRNMDPVCTVSDTVFQKGEKKLSEQVLDFFNEMGNNAFNEVIGDVALSKSGIDSDISHGMGRLKAITFKTVPDVISDGLIVDYKKNWKGRSYDTVVIVAPTKVEGDGKYAGEYVTAVIVMRNSYESNQRFYLHETISIKKDDLLFKTEGPQKGIVLGNSPSSIFNLLQKLVKGKENVEKISLSEDSNGNVLSEEQQTFFEDSVVRDDTGKLLVMYHGTPNAGFTVFRQGTYFTQHKEYADRYQNPGASSLSVKRTADHPDTYEVYLNIRKPFDTRIPSVKKLWDEQYFMKWGNGTPLMESGLPDWVEGMDIQEFIEENGLDYDGIILDEGGTGGYGDEVKSRGLSYMIMNPNQVKNISNKTPSADEDIRFSIAVDEAWESVMNGADSDFGFADSAVDFSNGVSYSDLPSILEEGYRALKNVSVDDRAISGLAKRLVKLYKSTYSAEDLAENMKRVFAFMKENDGFQFADLYRVMKEVAEPMIKKSQSYDSAEQQVYKELLNVFKGEELKVSEEQAKYLEMMYGEPFHKIAFRFGSRVRLSKTKGIELDSVYEQLNEESGFTLGYATPEEEAYVITEAIEKLRPQPKLPNGMNVMEQSYDVALEMFINYFEQQAQSKANEQVKQYVAQLKRKQKLIQEKNELRFKEAVKQVRKQEFEKRQRQAEYYAERLEEMKRAKSAAISAKDRAAAEKYEKLAEQYRRKYESLKKQSDQTIDELLAKNRITAHTIRENQARAHAKEQIKKNASAIVSYFNQNTDKKHIVEVLKEPVARFITAIDFTGAEDTKAAFEWEESLRMMKRLVDSRDKAIENGYEDIYDAFHGFSDDTSSVLTDMENFLDAYHGAKVTELSTESLKKLNGILRALRSTITNANKLFVNERTQSVSQLGEETIRELDSKRDKMQHTVVGDFVLKVADAGMLDSRSYFYRLGDAGMSIYDGLRSAFNDRVFRLREAQEYMAKVTAGIKMSDWTGNRAKVHTFVINGKELKLTTAQIMSIYELRKRGQALVHMLNGGIKPETIGRGRRAIERVRPLKGLTEYDLDIITDTLTSEQKMVADAMQQFMSNQCSEWGNETSMTLYGYERYNASNYFPIKVDGHSVDTKDDTLFFGLKNAGFSKKTVKNAGNALIVQDIFDVFTMHVSEMASYSTFTAPLLDAMKWYNYRDMDYSGDIAQNNGSVKEEIERVYGKDYLKFFEKLIQDINGDSVSDFTDKPSKKLVSNMKAASVGANIRVAIQQPTAILRATAVMSPKYLGQGIISNPAANVKKANQYSAIAQWKSWGYFETSIGRSMKGVITGETSVREKLTDKSMKLAQLGDDITWGYIWQACENEVKDKHPELEYDSEEFLQTVAKRFDDVIDQTQVVDSVLHRSHIMRNTNAGVQMATAFMAEPTKSYNLLMNAARDVYENKKGSKGKFGRAAVAFTATSFLTALAQSLIDAIRDEDDDKKFSEKYWEAVKDNFKDNMNLFGMIPYAKDVFSIINGYQVTRMDMQGVYYFIKGAEQFMNWMKNPVDSSGYTYREKHTFYQSFKKLLQGTSQLVGIPVYNMIRDISSFYHLFTGKTFGGSAKGRKERYSTMASAYVEGNDEIFEEEMQQLLDFGVAEETIQKGVSGQMKTMLREDGITEDQYQDYLEDEMDMPEEEAFFKTQEALYDSQYGRLYDEIDLIIANGSRDRSNIGKIVKDYTDHGKEAAGIKSAVTSKYKEMYLDAKPGEKANIKSALISVYQYLGDDYEKAKSKIESLE